MIYIHEESFETSTRFKRIPIPSIGCYHGTHWHDHYEIVIVEAGPINYFVEGNPEPLLLEPGDMILLLPNVLHYPVRVNDGENYIQVLDFKKSFLSEPDTAFSFLNPQNLPYYSVYTARLTNELRESFFALGSFIDNCKIGGEPNHLMLRGYYYTVIGYFRSHGIPVETSIRSAEESEQHVRIKTVCSYIGMHLSEDITIESLARVAGYSPSHLYRLFRNNVGCTVKEYIDNLKINEVQRLIRSGKTSVSELSTQLGFSHPNNLGRMYKRITGKCLSDEIKNAQIRVPVP